MTACAELHFNIPKEIGVTLDDKQYDHVPKSVERSHLGKVTLPYYETNKHKLTELLLTINWVS